MIIYGISQAPGSTWTTYEYFMLFHMTVLHGTPLAMTWINIYYTDIKILVADWKLMAFHGFFYMFANYLGFLDFDRAMYPIIDWKSTPVTIFIFFLGIAIFNVGFYTCFCNYADKHYKRRGEL